MKRFLFISMVCALISARALAAPSFGADGGARLQAVLNDITQAGQGTDSSVDVTLDALTDTRDSYWSITATGGSFATLVFKVTEPGYGDLGNFGVFDYADPSKAVQLFDGTSVTVGDQATLSIKLDGSVHVNLVDTTVDFAGNLFGYYFDTAGLGAGGGGFWYSDSALNADGADHMYAYQGKDVDTVQLPGLSAGLWTSNEYILAWEMGYGGGDKDYDDFVVMVESVNPIPAPGAILLGSLGVGLVGWMRRRRSL